MPITINGTAAERATMEALLRQLCPGASVNRDTGAVTVQMGPWAPQFMPGCCCLDNLVRSGFTTTINPLAGPNSVVPGTGGKSIGSLVGAATATPPAGNQRAGAGGLMVNGPGAGATTYVDISDNNGNGYFVHDAAGNRIDDPLFIILFHELCTGHATQSTQGARNPADPETSVIQCENTLRGAFTPPYTQRRGNAGDQVPAGTGRYPR